MSKNIRVLGRFKDYKINLLEDSIFVDCSWGILNFVLLNNLILKSKYCAVAGNQLYDIKYLSSLKILSNKIVFDIKSLKVGFFKEMVLEGLGYMFMVYSKERELRFEGGYSHGIYLKYGVGVVLAVEKKRILIYSLNKKDVSDLNMNIRKLKKVDVYKGKGIKDKDELIVLKVGKKR